MSLESRQDAARSLVSRYLGSMVDRPARWYGPMLPAEHPFSFAYILGLTEEHRDKLFMVAGFAKEVGQDKKIQFSQVDFERFLASDVKLQSIEASTKATKSLNYHRYRVYLVGQLPKGVSFDFSEQEKANLIPLELDETADDCVAAIKEFVAMVMSQDNGHPEIVNEEVATSNTASKTPAKEQSVPSVENSPAITCPVDTTCATVTCHGIPHTILQQKGLSLAPSGIANLCKRYNLIRGRWCHQDCRGVFVPETPSSKGLSCAKCVGARTSVRKSRIPELFESPSTFADIAPSVAQISAAIGNLASKFQSTSDLVQSAEASDFASAIKVCHIDSVAFTSQQSEYHLFSCNKCSGAIITSRKRKRQDANDCGPLCATCKNDARNKKRRENRARLRLACTTKPRDS